MSNILHEHVCRDSCRSGGRRCLTKSQNVKRLKLLCLIGAHYESGGMPAEKVWNLIDWTKGDGLLSATHYLDIDAKAIYPV